jgi:hypothetical protein
MRHTIRHQLTRNHWRRSAGHDAPVTAGDTTASQKPHRIFITGPAGAGKTVLAARLGRCLELPVYEMDRGRGAFESFDLEGNWIVEGSYVWQVEPLLERADVIVWLDIPLRYTVGRIVRRHVRLTALRRNPHRGLRLLFRFLRSQPQYFSSPARQPTGPTDWSALTRTNHEACSLHSIRRSYVRKRRGRHDAGRGKCANDRHILGQP